MSRQQPIGALEATKVPRYAGLGTFARIPMIECAAVSRRRPTVATPSGPVQLGLTGCPSFCNTVSTLFRLRTRSFGLPYRIAKR